MALSAAGRKRGLRPLSASGRKRKGSRRELQTKKLLESWGYRCIKAGGSLGLWDLVAIGPEGDYLCQVKSNRRPGPGERKVLTADGPFHDKVVKLMITWYDGRKSPEVMYL